MAMEWNNRNDWFDPNGGHSRESFEEHNERMTEFRRSHANVVMVNEPRLGEAALLERMRLWQVRHAMMETGGSRLANGTTDWSPLVPTLEVARYKLSQN
ncbi:unnamed protein product [marine sediment metagenome]|uniref:Uncharacterized protein n=1 Tax=marine sediment metagenome TaxID=412755 RepID=X0S331_9ZZZZ